MHTYHGTQSVMWWRENAFPSTVANGIDHYCKIAQIFMRRFANFTIENSLFVLGCSVHWFRHVHSWRYTFVMICTSNGMGGNHFNHFNHAIAITLFTLSRRFSLFLCVCVDFGVLCAMCDESVYLYISIRL